MAERWSTLGSPPTGQFEYWRELICAAFLALTPESDLRSSFTGTVTQWPLGNLNLARIDSQRQRVRRTDKDIGRSPRSGYYANLQLRGGSQMSQLGRTTMLRPGDLAVVDTRAPFTFDFVMTSGSCPCSYPPVCSKRRAPALSVPPPVWIRAPAKARRSGTHYRCSHRTP